MSAKIKDQPNPSPGGAPIFALVREDMEERERLGIERYGQTLQANDGRDSLVDAYQEALDMAIYLRKAICERDQERRVRAEQLARLADRAWDVVP